MGKTQWYSHEFKKRLREELIARDVKSRRDWAPLRAVVVPKLFVTGQCSNSRSVSTAEGISMKISDHLVMVNNTEDDCTILKRKSFPVNMRLYKSSHRYKNIILEIIQYMDEHLNSEFTDWKSPIGIAAPNLGFPLRIIGYKVNNQTNANHQFCLNPVITSFSDNKIDAQGNCGSLKLTETVTVERHAQIDFEYFDLEGNLVLRKMIGRHEGGFTVQNTVDQLNGISVLDKKKKETK